MSGARDAREIAERDEMADIIGDLINVGAKRAQEIVPSQPWGRNGNAPIPLEIYFDARDPAGSGQRWSIKYVSAVQGSRRVYSWAHGRTILDALGQINREQP